MTLKINLPFVISLMWPTSLMANTLFVFLKPVDLLFIVILISFPYAIRFGKWYVIAYFFLLSLSSMAAFRGFGLNQNFNPTTLVFVYKYMFVVASASMFYGLGMTGTNRSSTYLASLITLGIWTISYPFFLLSGVIDGSFRPSFPFADDYNVSDAHLLSFVLGFGFNSVLYLVGKQYVSAKMAWVSLPILLMAVFVTGSRTGVLIITLYLVIFTFRAILQLFSNRRLSPGIIGYSVVIVIFFLASLFLFQSQFEIFASTVLRAINFNLMNDTSSSNRVILLFLAISEAIDGFPFGAGFIHSEAIFYDGMVSILLAHFGFFGLFISFLVSIVLVLKARRMDKKLGDLALVLIIGNLITEYVLVSRGAIFSVGFIAYVYGLERSVLKSDAAALKF
jgi:hypothetical protein